MRSRVKSNFSPTKERIELSEADPESLLDRPTPPAQQVDSSGAAIRTSLDSAETIERYNQKMDMGIGNIFQNR